MAQGVGTAQFAGDRGAGQDAGTGTVGFRRQRLELLRSQLDTERASFLSHWRDLNDFILPRRARFFTADANRGDRRTQKIIDSTATLAVRTLRSGMMAGVTSPARPWFRLTTPDQALSELGPVKDWLYFVAQRMLTVFLRSNLYKSLPVIYGDLGTFATSALLIEEDFEGDVIWTQPIPIGSYMVANDARLRPRIFYREFRMTVRQLVDEYGRDFPNGPVHLERFSDHVQAQWKAASYETWIDVSYFIYPNEDYDPNKLQSKYKLYRSVTYERGASSAQSGRYLRDQDFDRFLRDSGYDYFPILVPRWEVTGEDVYGTDCPGMTALGDIRQLQTGERRGLQAIEKKVNPAMVADPALQTAKTSLLPGDVTYVRETEGQRGFRPAHEVSLSIQELELKQDQVRGRIRRAFFEDLFLMLATTTRREITAREIEERHEEKLLALGPVLEQLNQDLLDPLIDITFDIMLRQGLIPPAPDELRGQELKVEYISVMAQAQKLLGLAGVERFAGFVGQVAQARPDVLDKIDADQLIDVYADITSIPPGIVRPDEDVAAIREARQQQAAAQAALANAEQASKSVRNLAGSPVDEDNALGALVSQARAGQVVPQVVQ